MTISRRFPVQSDCPVDILFNPQPLFVQLGELIPGIDDAGGGFVLRRGDGGEILRRLSVVLLHAKSLLVEKAEVVAAGQVPGIYPFSYQDAANA